MEKKKVVRITSLSKLYFLFLIALCAFLYFGHGILRNVLEDKPAEEVVIDGNFSVHFIELGNKYTGDSIYIKAGDNDILIDAGSRKNSADDIGNYIDDYMDDNTLEYVIATHADQDHISAFIGTKDIPGIFDRYECEVIIDFAITNKDSQTVKDYFAKRDAEVELGAKHYTALDCINKTNGASTVYDLGDGIKMTVLNSLYYTEKSSDENNYSVCLLFSCGTKHFLFTGDLEKEGEEHLVELNVLPEVELFKAGHHGSKTSSTDKLLSVIKPKIVCVCCCAGSDEYTDNLDNQFPTQDFVSRVSKYTDRVYVTSIATDDEVGYKSFNGNIVVTYNAGVVSVNCSNNNIILKDTDWFKNYRKWE